MGGPQPQLVAALLCEQAFQQAESGNWCIIGTFDTLSSSELPFTHPGFAVFVALSDFRGGTLLEAVVRDEDGEVVQEVRGKVPKTPMGLFQCAFPFAQVEFKHAGVHTLELMAGGQLVTLRSFRVLHDVPVDPEEDQAHGRELCEQYKEQLIADAVDVWKEHPEAHPVGMIAAAGAASRPDFRRSFEAAFGAPPPPTMTFVGLIDRPTATRILRDEAPAGQEWLDAPFETEGLVLPIVIATKGGLQIRHEIIEPDW